MGKHFGELAFIRGVVYYAISAHEQKPFAMVAGRGIPNVITRTTATVLTWLPNFIIAYAIYRYCEDLNHHYHRKNPLDFLYEVDPNPPKDCRLMMELKPPCKPPTLDDIICPPPEKDPCEREREKQLEKEAKELAAQKKEEERCARKKKNA